MLLNRWLRWVDICTLLSSLWLIVYFSSVTFVSAVTLRVKGPPSVVVQLKTGRTASGHSSLLQNSAPLGLWCQAVDADTKVVIPAEEIFFTHSGHRIPAVFTDESRRNATYTREQIMVEDIGRWTCHVRTRDYGNATGDIMVYMRPVVNTSQRVDDRVSSKFYFDLSSMTVVNEETAKLECPITGHPKPTIVWHKNNYDLHNSQDTRISIEKNVLEIRNVTDADAGTYTCMAKNVISHKGEKQSFDVRADRSLRIKSKYAWVTPLVVITIILTLLIATIILCELRKRRTQPKLLAPDDD